MINVDLKVLIVEFASFLVLVAILWKVLFKPITNFLERRSQDIKDTLEGVEKSRIEIEQMKSEYQAQIREAEAKAEGIIQQAVKDSEVRKDKIILQAKEEADKLIKKAKLEISKEKEKALQSLRKEVADLSVLAASRVLERSIDEDIAHQLVAEFIDEIDKSPGRTKD